MLEIDTHIQRSGVHPTNKALWEYIYEHHPKMLPEIIQDLCVNFKFLYKHISQWCEVRLNLPSLDLWRTKVPKTSPESAAYPNSCGNWRSRKCNRLLVMHNYRMHLTRFWIDCGITWHTPIFGSWTPRPRFSTVGCTLVFHMEDFQQPSCTSLGRNRVVTPVQTLYT